MKGVYLALSVAVALTSCARRRRPVETRDTPENQALLAKIDPYLKCQSEHVAIVFQLADAYRDRVTLRTGNTNEHPHLLPDPIDCLDGIVVARLRSPALPRLEAAADAFGAALARVHLLTLEGGASSELLVAFDEFDRAQAALFDQIFLLNHDVHVKQLARREQRSGPTLATSVEGAKVRAEPLVRHVTFRFDSLDRLDLAAFDTDLADFIDAMATLRSRARSDNAAAARLSGLQEALDAGNELTEAAKQLRRRIVDKVPFTESESLLLHVNAEASVPGSPGAMIAAYNRLVESD